MALKAWAPRRDGETRGALKAGAPAKSAAPPSALPAFPLGGDQTSSTSPIISVAEMPALTQLISPLEGEMSRQDRGGATDHA